MPRIFVRIDRNGDMAMMYTMTTMKIRANIVRISMKFGESSETNNAGTSANSSNVFSVSLSNKLASSGRLANGIILRFHQTRAAGLLI